MGADPTGSEVSAFAGLRTVAGLGGGVVATERRGRAIARIAAHRMRSAEVAEAWRDAFGVVPPNAPRQAGRGDVRIAGIGPDTWLATRESMGNDFAASLQSLLGHCASVCDQSDAHVILELAGPRVRATLAKQIPIDLHARCFGVGDVAQTLCGHMSVLLWRLEDTARGDPAFEIWAGRSFAVSLHRAIAHSAAEFGFVRQTG